MANPPFDAEWDIGMRIQSKNIRIGVNGTIYSYMYFTASECASMRSDANCNVLLFDKSVIPTNRDNRILPDEKWFMSETNLRECGLATWLAQHQPVDSTAGEIPPAA